MSPQDYLVRCLVDNVGTYRLSNHPLPEEITIVQGRIVRTPNPESKRHWEKLRDEAVEEGVRYLNPIAQGEILRQSSEIEAEAQEVEALRRAWQEEMEQWELAEAKAISEGTRLGPRTVARLTRPRCPDRLPFPWFALVGYLKIGLIGLVEVFQLTWAFLDSLGIDTGKPDYEFAQNPIGVMGGVASAIAATGCLILLWHLLVSHATAFAAGLRTAGPLRTGARLVGLCFLCAALFTGTLFIATLRHGAAVSAREFQDVTPGQNAASPTGMGMFVFMTLLLPAGAAYIQFKISKSPYWARRDALQAERAKQSQAADHLHQPGDQQADAGEMWKSKLARLEERQTSLEARRKAVNDFVVAARDRWLKELDDAQQATALFARTLRAALVRDRYYFLLFANCCQVMHLVPTEPVCLTQDRISAAFTDAAGASSPAEPVPASRVFRPLLTDGRRSELDS
jgi:hypothetical protein